MEIDEEYSAPRRQMWGRFELLAPVEDVTEGERRLRGGAVSSLVIRGRSRMPRVSPAARKTKGSALSMESGSTREVAQQILPFHVRMEINCCTGCYYSHWILSITVPAINSVVG